MFDHIYGVIAWQCIDQIHYSMNSMNVHTLMVGSVGEWAQQIVDLNFSIILKISGKGSWI
jgi:hypothetical protein